MARKNIDKTKELLIRYQVAPDYEKREIEDKVFILNKPLVYSTLKKFKIPRDKFEDFFQEASKGMLDAIRRFDPQNNVAFSTFAVNTMKGVIKNGYRDKGWLLKVPRSDKEKGIRIVLMDLVKKDEIELPEQELNRIQNLINAQNPIDLTDEVINNQPDFTEDIEQTQDHITSYIASELLSNLNDRDRLLLQLVYIEEWPIEDVSVALILDLKEAEEMVKNALMQCRLVREDYLSEIL